MKCFIVLSALVAVALAKPGHGYVGAPLVAPLSYVAPLAYAKVVVPGAPIGIDGRVVDTPEVAHAKAEHAAAHINEKVALAREAVNSADAVVYAAPAVHSVAYSAPALSYGKVYSAAAAVPVTSTYNTAYAPAVAYGGYYGHGAPLSIDGRVVDTPEVAHAKAAHYAAHAEAKARVGYGYGAHYAYAAPAW